MNALDPTALLPARGPDPALGPTLNRGGSPVRASTEAEKLRKVAEDFESIFIFQMLDTMYSGLDTDGPFSGGQGEKMFRSLMNEEIAKSISASSGFGISDAVHRQLLQIQEMNNANRAV